MIEQMTNGEARERLASVRAAMSTHIPETTIFIANIILVSTAIRVAGNLNDSRGLSAFGTILPIMVFVKIMGLFLPRERDTPFLPVLIGFLIACAAFAAALVGSDEATNASLLQLDSPRLQAFFHDRYRLAADEQRNFQRSLAIHCFQNPGPKPQDAAECRRLNAFFQAHPLPVSGDVE